MLLSLLTLWVASVCAQTPSTIVQDATVFSLIYGYPLLAFEKLARPLSQALGVNQLYNARALATASETAVVAPNVDTLYSAVILDLTNSSISVEPGKKVVSGKAPLSIPDDQFVLFSFYDPFGDNWANAGTGHPSNGNSWVVRQKPDNVTSYGVQVEGGTVYMNSPAAYGILLVRWLVNATNLAFINDLQDQLLVTAINNTAPDNSYPSFLSLPGVNSTESPANNVLYLLANFVPACQPENTSFAQAVNNTLHAAGIVPNPPRYLPTPGLDLDQSNQTALRNISIAIEDATQSLGNGWTSIQSNLTGNFGENYEVRAGVAAAGYLMLTSPDAIYPSWTNSSAGGNQSDTLGGTLSLTQGESILYTFSAKPPLANTGFWSLTLYNEEHFLVANPRNVYAVGDRSNLTYADGTMVYPGSSNQSSGNGTTASGNAQESFQVLVQAVNVPPPTNWTANWLPAPQNGGEFYVLLRWYGAQEPLLNGEYQYPIVTKQAAITNATSSNGTSSSGTGSNGTSSGGSGGASGGSTSTASVFDVSFTLVIMLPMAVYLVLYI